MESSYKIGDPVLIKGKVISGGKDYLIVQVPQVIPGQEVVEVAVYKNQSIPFHNIDPKLLMVVDGKILSTVMTKFCVATLTDEINSSGELSKCEQVFDMSESLKFSSIPEEGLSK